MSRLLGVSPIRNNWIARRGADDDPSSCCSPCSTPAGQCPPGFRDATTSLPRGVRDAGMRWWGLLEGYHNRRGFGCNFT